jgi:hypothetical protein
MDPVISPHGQPRARTKTYFDLISISDLACTVAVIENGHEIWKQITETQNSLAKEGQLALRWGGEQEESSTKKTSKFTKKAGRKREYNISGWSYEGINFYNKLRDKWKRIASENKDQAWEKLEAEWNEYIEEYNLLYHYGRSRERKLNPSTHPEDMPALPSMDT